MIEIRVDPAFSVMSKLVGWNQPKSSLSVAGLKFSAVLVPHAQVILVVVPPDTGGVVGVVGVVGVDAPAVAIAFCHLAAVSGLSATMLAAAFSCFSPTPVRV